MLCRCLSRLRLPYMPQQAAEAPSKQPFVAVIIIIRLMTLVSQ